MNRSVIRSTHLLSLALIGAGLTAPALRADDSAEIQALRAEIQAMEQKLSALEQKEAQREQAPSAPATAPLAPGASSAPVAANVARVTVDDQGLVAATPDRANVFHVGGIAQFDSREFLNDGGGVVNNGFILRRARITTDGTLDKIYSFLFTPEFGNGSGGTANAVTILDANGTIAFTPQFQLKFGKFKSPVGLEELQPDPVTAFVERTLVNNLMPNRDVGAVVGGSLWNGAVSYTAGLVNGIADNTTSSGNSDFDNDKDVVGRLFVQPFSHEADSAWHGLGFGIAGSEGRQKGLAAVTAGDKTDAQQTFFKYNAAVVADGRTWRVSPQAYDYAGPFSLMAEYVVSAVNVRPTAVTATSTPAKVQLENKAWEATAGYVLTGENATYTGVTPLHPFNWTQGTWGAWQVTARYSDLKIDSRAFPLFASPLSNANEAKAVGIGLNWYLSKAVRFTQDYFQTNFELPAATTTAQILRQDEKALVTRLQISF